MGVIVKDINQKEKKSDTKTDRRNRILIIIGAVGAAIAGVFALTRKKQITNEQALNEIRTANFQPIDSKTQLTSDLFRELSFLRKMLDGQFDNSTEDDLDFERDKGFFRKYKSMTRLELESIYADVEKRLNDSVAVL